MPVRQPTVESFSGSAEELKRAKHVLAFLLTGSKPAAMKASGLSRDAHSRIIKMFIEHGHAFDRERPGRPTVYADAIMEKAYEKLTDIDSGLLTGRQLQSMLVSEGLLAPASSIKAFILHLHQYISGQGTRLITNSVKTTFFITLTDVVERLKYARMMDERLKTIHGLDALVFVDEVRLEESPHPKGESPRGIQWPHFSRAIG